MSSKYIKTPNQHYFKNNTENKKEKIDKKNKVESEQKTNYKINVNNTNYPANKINSFKTNYFPSLTSIITNYKSSTTSSNNSFTEKKRKKISKKNNPHTIFDSKKSLFTSIDDGIKTSI